MNVPDAIATAKPINKTAIKREENKNEYNFFSMSWNYFLKKSYKNSVNK
jgi:hypothetical protein